MLDRTDRSLVGVWWWTVDRWLLASALLLMVVGTLLVMAAGPAVVQPDVQGARGPRPETGG